MEEEYVPEFAAFERVGLPGDALIGISYDQFTKTDKFDMFIINVDRIAREIIGTNASILSYNDIEYLVNKARIIPKIEFKNPTAYILSYIITSSGRNPISTTKLNKIYKLLQTLSTRDDVDKVDLIRYSRYWNKTIINI